MSEATPLDDHNIEGNVWRMKMKRVFGIFAVVIMLPACTAAEKKEMAVSDQLENKAQTYCAITLGYANDPKTLVSCKEHYIQGATDAQKTQ